MLSDKEIRIYNEIRTLIDEWSRLGEKTYPDGTRWIGHIPHRALEAYLHRLFGPLESDAIGNLERQLGLSLPGSFKGLLLSHNGMALFTDYLCIDGLRRSWSRTNMLEFTQQPYSILTYNIQERPPRVPNDVLFVGSLGDKRDLAGLLPDGRIHFFDKDTGVAQDKSYPSLFDFILEETRRARTLFDDFGRRLDKSDLLPR